jgi:hypothetical protein
MRDDSTVSRPQHFLPLVLPWHGQLRPREGSKQIGKGSESEGAMRARQVQPCGLCQLLCEQP